MGRDEIMTQILDLNVSSVEPFKVPLNLERKVKEAKLRATLFMLNTLLREDIISSMGKMLLCGEKADEYYDLISTFLQFLDKPRTGSDLVNSLVTEMDRFCSRVTEEEYCRLIRTITLRGYMTGDLHSLCAVFNLLIIEWYQRGMQSCGWTTARVPFLSGFDVTLLESIVVVLGSCKINPRPRNRAIRVVPFVRDKDVKAVKSLLTVMNHDDVKFVDHFVSNIKDLFKAVRLEDLFYATVYSSIANMFSPLPQQNVCMHFIRINREEFTEGNLVDAITRTIIEGAGGNILKYRHLFVRENGVTLKFVKPFDCIDSVTLREVHEEGFHYFYVRYCMYNQYRDLILNIEDLESSFVTFLYEIDFTITIAILCWLGLKNRLLEGLRNLKGKLQNADVRSTCRSFIEQISSQINLDNIVYEEPAWWNYEQGKSAPPKHRPEISKTVRVATHSRRLPEGQHASPEAQALAKKYCMILEPGYTLVNEFEKRQRIKL